MIEERQKRSLKGSDSVGDISKTCRVQEFRRESLPAPAKETSPVGEPHAGPIVAPSAALFRRNSPVALFRFS